MLPRSLSGETRLEIGTFGVKTFPLSLDELLLPIYNSHSLLRNYLKLGALPKSGWISHDVLLSFPILC